jgi:uncharacterized protein
MILIDANLLIYSVNEDAPLHLKARSWLERSLAGEETVALSWNVLLAFLRLTTRAGVFQKPLPVDVAFAVVQAWLGQPSVVILEPGPRHLRLLRDLIIPLGTGGNLSSDAHLAAIAIDHGAELCTTDSDFARFPQLRWRNPLQ